MYFLMSGEGPTDLGTCINNSPRCFANEYDHGPMTIIIDQLVEQEQGYSLLESAQYEYVSKSMLVQRASELKAARKSLGLPGKRRAKETRYFFNNARVFARIAKERADELGDEVVAILFRDSDGTATASRGLWSEKHRSMLDGFAEEEFSRGVPMLPKPKSEAWVLCALKNQYEGCNTLEDRSGNDNSPNSLKKELQKHLGEPPTREVLCRLVTDRAIDVQRIEMPSFIAFAERLSEVV
jgi:hypothetical protein